MKLIQIVHEEDLNSMGEEALEKVVLKNLTMGLSEEQKKNAFLTKKKYKNRKIKFTLIIKKSKGGKPSAAKDKE